MTPIFYSVSSVLLALETTVHLPSYPQAPEYMYKIRIECLCWAGHYYKHTGWTPNWLGLVPSLLGKIWHFGREDKMYVEMLI